MALSKYQKSRMLDRYAGEKIEKKEVYKEKDNALYTPDLETEEEELLADADTVVADADAVATAGFMGLPTMAWIAIGGVALYYAYSKGMFKKLIK